MLKLHLFRSPQICDNERLLTTDVTGRMLALFTYLVLKDGPHERSLLADLLWSEITEKQAKTNLRYVLYDLRKVLGDYLVITRQTVAFNHNAASWVDARVFDLFMESELATAEPQMITEVLKLYRGELLEGFYIQNAPNFERWLEQQRRYFHNQTTATGYRLCQEALGNGDYDLCISAGRHLLTLEPGYEEVHRLLMQGLALTGQRTAALAQFALCQETLQLEYAVTPDESTIELFHKIQSGEISTCTADQVSLQEAIKLPQQSLHHHSSVQHGVQINWESIPQSRPFVGRSEELGQLANWAGRDRYQLIGLFGLPGQGKSALAAELVGRLAESEVDDNPLPFEQILWYSATAFPSLLELLQTWCQQLDLGGHTLSDGETSTATAMDPQDGVPVSLELSLQKVLSHLRNQRVLLVLDDVDALITEPLHTDLHAKDVAVTKQQLDSTLNANEQNTWGDLGELLRRIAEAEHGGCLLVLSSVVPTIWRDLSQQSSSVRHLTLTELQHNDVDQLLTASGLQLTAKQIDDVATASASNPSLVFQQISLARTFGGDLVFARMMDDSLNEEIYKLLYPIFQRLPAAEQDILLTMVDVVPNMDVPELTVQSLWQRVDGQMAMAAYLQSVDTLQCFHFLEVHGPTKRLKLPELVRHFIEVFLYRSISGEILLLLQNHRQGYVQPPTDSVFPEVVR